MKSKILTFRKLHLILLFILQQPSLPILERSVKMAPTIILIRHAEAIHSTHPLTHSQFPFPEPRLSSFIQTYKISHMTPTPTPPHLTFTTRLHPPRPTTHRARTHDPMQYPFSRPPSSPSVQRNQPHRHLTPHPHPANGNHSSLLPHPPRRPHYRFPIISRNNEQ
jgi:hypothetical protein